MKKFKITLLVEDDGQDNNNFYDSDTLKHDILDNVVELDLNLVQIEVEEQ